jgi:chemotaxis protein CheZ
MKSAIAAKRDFELPEESSDVKDELAPNLKGTAASKKFLDPVMRELMSIAEYVSTMKTEIAALQANEFSDSHLPDAGGELNSVVKATAQAADSIMSAGEEILDYSSHSFESYRDKVELKVLEIFEACAFQDLTGQRIKKVAESLGLLEKRLRRFVEAVGAEDDPDAIDEEERKTRERRDALILHGPQDEGTGVDQNDIDNMF